MTKSALSCNGLLALFLSCLALPSRASACVVGNGTSASCTESELNACLPRGGRFDGTATFNCGGNPATITVTIPTTITVDTSIDGGGLVTISGGNGTQIFVVNSGTALTLANLAISDGSSLGGDGGAIYSDGTLTVTNSTFSGNSGGFGGAIFNGGTLTLTNSTLSGNTATGGAIYNDYGGTLTVTNCTFSGNSGGPGGAIASDITRNYGGTLTVTNFTFSGNTVGTGANGHGGGAIANGSGDTLTVTNSTFSGNSAHTSGPYIIYGGSGGAIFNPDGGTLTVTNSTFSGNTGGSGGAIANGGTLTVTNGTFSGNTADALGGAIINSDTVTVTNSTFSGNSDHDGGTIYNYSGTLTLTNAIVASSTSRGNCVGSITDGGHNLDSDGSCGVGPATDPKLDPEGLANNGGPTQTIALRVGSPAINAGDETVCAAPPVNNLDQRGYVRPGTGATRCSIGAYEFNSPGSGAPTAGGGGGGCSISRRSLSSASLLSLLVSGAVLVCRRLQRQRSGHRR